MRSVRDRTGPDGPKLEGNLGTLGLFFSIMSFNAPLVVVMGVIPIMIAVGNGIGTPILFVIGGVIVAAFATSFLRMSNVLQRPGAFYAYVTAGLGKQIGLGAGFAMLLAYFACAAGYLPFAGNVLGSLVSETFNGPELPWFVWAFVFWAVVALVGYLRIDFSAKVTAVILMGELIVVFIYDVAVFARGGAEGLSGAPFAPAHWFDGSFAIGLLLACGMFGGYEVTVLFRDEVRNPERTIPRAAYGLIGCAVLLYAGTSWLFINAVGVGNAVSETTAESTGAIDTTIAEFGGQYLLDAATVLVATSALAVIVCAHNVGARYLFNLSADGVIPRALSRVHPRHGSPYRASMAMSVAALVLNGGVVLLHIESMAFYGAMLGIAALTGISVQFVTAVAIPVYLTRTGNHRGHVLKSVVAPVFAAIGFGVIVALSVTNFPILTGGSQALSNVLLVFVFAFFAAGVVLALWLRHRRPQIYAKIGRQ
ncbi:APC family permease [Rhodococcus fascians]|nr:APC family permease [Rhodococcus fascians]MBY3997809.1 APC family permease [Rhodococcus fascians]MBY4002808.1 APC family permease [Rhodococcus fascians]MBY4006799.1 APC family permease [Rhodococcus fascians]MBY4019406.1 APC family permease [Rhodococcus fascians]